MKTLEVLKNCDNCIKKDACKYLEDYNALVTSDKFYGMFEYLEWNNLERIFKGNALSYKCYHPAFPNGKIEDKIHPASVIIQAFRKELGNEVSSWMSEPKDGIIEYHERQTNNKKQIAVSDLDWEVKIVNKYTPVL
jgi:hypothetical protein